MRRDSNPRSGGLQTAEAIRKSPFLEELLLFPLALYRHNSLHHSLGLLVVLIVTFVKSQLADETPPRVTDRLGPRLSSHLVTKRHHAALIGFDLRQMQGDVSVELVEEWDPITNQDR